MTESIVLFLSEWSVRTAGLAAATATLLWVMRVRDAHVRLTVWTTVLAGLTIMAVAMVVVEPIPVWIGAETPAPPVLAPSTVAAPMEIAEPSIPGVSTPQAFTVADALVALWFLVAVVMLVRVIVGVRLAAKLRNGSRRVDDGVYESDAVTIPLTVGVLQPVVILPCDWREWDREMLQAVLEHERAHVRRRDPVRQLLASVFRSIAWFHPLAWWLRAHLIELAELASDDAAVSATGDRIVYAETLLDFIERARGRVCLEGVAMASPRTRARRMDRLLDENHCPSHPLSTRAIVAVAALLAPVVYLSAAMRPQRLEAQSLVLARIPVAVAPQISAAQPVIPGCGVQGPYRKWLEEDVVYIVSRPEREEFLQLRNDQECQEFIEGFWQRRPAAFKEEHYRRTAYANERFPSGVPGWRTDRGRIYITYGPPEEIESHPSGSNARTYPFEIWRYTSIKGVGDDVWIEFVDTKQDGDYRMLTMRDAAALALLRRQPGPGPGEPTPRVSMMLVDPRVYVDGKDFGRVGLQAVSGYTLYVAVKGLGRFVLSLDRHHDVGLTEIGSTSGRRVEVEVGGHTMRIDCAADVSSAGPMTVFGRLDSSYQPEGELEFSATGITSK